MSSAASHNNISLTTLDRTRTSGYEESSQGHAHSRHWQPEEAQEQDGVSLPRPDGGKDAWLFLVGSFFIEALIWGFPFSFGVFQEYYSTHAPFSEEPAGITIIGTSAMGIMYLGAPFISAFLQRFPLQRRWCSVIGLFLIVIALVSSSFATKVWQLILTQGILYAIGGTLLYFPTIVFMNEWFVQRKGFAFGVMWAGTGCSGICIPFVMGWGLEKYGFGTMLRAWAVVMVIFAGPLLYSVKPRIPVSQTALHRPNLNFGFLKTSTFWVLQAGNVLEGLGFFIPNIWLPTYAQSLGLSPISGTTLVALFNTTSVFGVIILGSLTDKLHVTSVIMISTVGATLSVFLFWGFAGSLPLLCIFSLIYGLFAGGFSSTWTGITREVKKKDDRAEMGLVFGLLAAGRGIGSVLSGPLSEALVSHQSGMGQAHMGYGTRYEGLIIFTGISAMLGGMSWVWRKLGWM